MVLKNRQPVSRDLHRYEAETILISLLGSATCSTFGRYFPPPVKFLLAFPSYPHSAGDFREATK
jgi:hypothetical protein